MLNVSKKIGDGWLKVVFKKKLTLGEKFECNDFNIDVFWNYLISQFVPWIDVFLMEHKLKNVKSFNQKRIQREFKESYVYNCVWSLISFN